MRDTVYRSAIAVSPAHDLNVFYIAVKEVTHIVLGQRYRVRSRGDLVASVPPARASVPALHCWVAALAVGS